MFIIIEGADGTGKTTLANKLAGYLEHSPGRFVTQLHRGVPKGDPIDEYETAVKGYVPGGTVHVIADRWHIGEMIYGPLYRGGSGLGRAGFRHVELFLRSRGALTVICDAEESVVKQRLYARGEEYLRPEHLGRVLSEFRALVPVSLAGSDLLIRPSFVDAEHCSLRDIVERASMLEFQAEHLANQLKYIGDPHPRVLLLGDARCSVSDPNPLPFVPRGGADFNRYLLENLPLSVYKRCGMANALETHLPTLVATLGYPKVVALGGVADAACRGLKHSTVPHPQSAQAHNAQAGQEYGAEILRAMLEHRVSLTPEWERA